MNTVKYRSLVKEDYEPIKHLIGEAFGFNEFIADKNFLNSVLNFYLHSCILGSSFSKVAEKDNKVIGVILGDSEKDKNRLKRFHNTISFAFNTLKLFITNKENREFLKAFIQVQKTYKELIQGKEDQFQGCIQLFIVSEESRGLGVGKSLLSHLFQYMKKEDVTSLYLYTDNECNYEFYDRQNFQRIQEKAVNFGPTEEDFNVFLYRYNFNS
ncbi:MULTISPECIES: GNAT family N-acetyltransferase [Bacillus cereus group]|uniref:Acetyltransferase (GNAT) family protein n=2 Tax=Bacillus cereus group TaxID=86661 RepID=A0A1Y6A296_9BACI|nr:MULTISPECIES: GNAT family N-acetyltransferase [Bacillus cereus group]HDR4419937.1 GNAT family N-acetyltransferase [Bacillus cereus]MDG1620211.1 GNAT family N-acetyltransferase [Bacillus mobilis]MDX5839787.1 GNAT family N-acetyltransferase [Bacillus cereus group sp. BfR-BA-01700]NEL00439.1 GNAT family N-acetyltransferase [Bacillus mobilis]OJE47528.1 GNAT family acetyltransferase [Bacillus mobilis]